MCAALGASLLSTASSACSARYLGPSSVRCSLLVAAALRAACAIFRTAASCAAVSSVRLSRPALPGFFSFFCLRLGPSPVRCSPSRSRRVARSPLYFSLNNSLFYARHFFSVCLAASLASCLAHPRQRWRSGALAHVPTLNAPSLARASRLSASSMA